MDRTTRVMGALGTVALVATMAFAMVVLGGAPSNAGGFPCPPGAPDNSTLCSESGWQVAIASGEATAAEAAAAGVTGATAPVAAGITNAAGSAAATGLVGLGGALVVDALIDTSSTSLTTQPGVPAGHVTSDSKIEFAVLGYPPHWGDQLAVTIMVTQHYCTGSGMTQSQVDTCFGGSHNASHYFQPRVIDQVTTRYWGGSSLSTLQNAFCAYTSATARWACTDQKQYTLTPPSGAHALDYIRVGTWNGGNLTYTWDTFYPEGHALYTPGQQAGVKGTMVSTGHCMAVGGAITSVTHSVPVEAPAGQVPVTLPPLNCLAGSVLVDWMVQWVTPYGTETVYQYSAPEWVTDIPVEYPGCVDGGCQPSLWQKQSAAPSLFCGIAAVGCPDWWTDPGKADHYECRFGTYPAPLGLCGIFRKPGSISPNSDLQVQPNGQVTGSPNPVISTNPADYANIDALVDIRPWTPIPGSGGIPDPVPSSSSSECFPHGWGVFNPLEWVYRPTVCALTWAYVPPAGSLEDIASQLRDDVGDKPPFSIVEPGGELVHGFFSQTSGSCAFGNFTPTLAQSATIPCEQPDSWAPVYLAMTVVIWLLALWRSVVMIMAGLGNRSGDA